MLRSIVVLGLVGWGVCSNLAFPHEHARLLPETTLFFASTTSIENLVSQWRKTNLSRLNDFPALNNVLSELAQYQLAASGSGLRDFKLDDLDSRVKGSVSYAVAKDNQGEPASILLIDTEKSDQGMIDWLERRYSELRRMGWREEQLPNDVTTSGTSSIHRFVKVAADGKRLELATGVVEGVYCIATDLELLKSIVENMMQGSAASLANKEAFRSGLSSIDLGFHESIIFFVDPVGMSQIYYSNTNAGSSSNALTRSHGLDAIRGITGKVAVLAEGFDFVFEAMVFAPQPHVDAMKLIAFRNQPEIIVPPWMPNYPHTVYRIEFDFTDFLKHLSKPFDDLVTEGTLQEILEDMKASDGPEVDLESDLFTHFASEVCLLSESSFPVTKTSERSVVGVSLKDPASVAEALSKLLKNDPNSQALRIPGQPNELWRFGIQDSNGPGYSSAGLMVAGNYLYLASNSDAIRKLVLSFNGGGLRAVKSEDFQVALQKLDKLAGKEGCFRFVVRMDQDVRTAYELLRLEQTKGSESTYAQLLNKWIESSRARGAKLPDFSGLPEFEQIDDYLGIAATHGRVVKDGWLLNGFVLRK